MIYWGWAWSNDRSVIVMHLVSGWIYLIGSMVCFRLPIRGWYLLVWSVILNLCAFPLWGAALASGWAALPLLGLIALWIRLIVLRFRTEGRLN